MAESEDVTRLWTTWVCRAVDFDDVGQLIWMHLLLLADTARDALVRIDTNLVPKDLTADGYQVVRVGPRNVDALWLEELLGWNETLWAELIITEGSQQLTHQDVTLHVFDLNMSHITSDKLNLIL